MHVRDLVDGGVVHGHVVVDVGHIGDVHGGIRYVYVLHVTHARAVRRNVHFARAEREPRDATAATE